MNQPLVYIVTVNWNRSNDTLECLESLFDNKYPNFRILVVDNGSTDESFATIRQKFPDIDLIRIENNLGFAGGYNAGIGFALESGADFVYIINNDTTIDPQALSILMDHYLPEIGILAPLIYYANTSRIWSAGGYINLWNLERIQPLKDQLDPENWLEVVERDYVTGCAMLLSRNTIQTIGLFDDNFHAYYEDADYCIRVKKAGYRICVIPKARVWHKVASSSGGYESPNERYWYARSSVYFFRKHPKNLQKLVVVIWRSASALLTSIRLIRKRQRKSLSAYWNGLSDGYRDQKR